MLSHCTPKLWYLIRAGQMITRLFGVHTRTVRIHTRHQPTRPNADTADNAQIRGDTQNKQPE